MSNNRLYIVMAIEHYNPLGQIRSLGEAGIAPVYIAIKGRAKIASTSKYISNCHYVDSVEDGYEILLKEYGKVADDTGLKPFLFCSDDKTVGYLDEHYDELVDKFIFFNAGSKGRIGEYMDKNNILELAKKHGLNVLEACVCKRGEIPEGIEYPIITKSISPNVGGWKSDVHICHSAEELKAAYEQIQAHTVLVQKYIEKKNEYALEGFSIAHGKYMLNTIGSTYQYLLPDYYSPTQDVSNVDDEFLNKALQSMMEEIGFEGIFEIEFLIDQDDKLYFLEINFRNATWSYASTKAGMPLPVLWSKCMLLGEIPKDTYKKIPEGFTAMVEPIDYAKRVKTGKLSLAEWLIAFKETNCGYYYSADDVEPWRVCVENWEKLG